MKETGLKGYVYEFSVDYEPFNPPINVTKAISIFYEYFMAKYKTKNKMIQFITNIFLGLTFLMGVHSLSCISRCPKNCLRGKLPPVSVRVWFRISVRIRAAGVIFLGGSFPRTVFQ